uniref:Uncharacterized protein n=1 Tax=Fagus sylvatica TaxID=28930 RepID=A0A2N9HW36_FAGSY
MLEPYSPSGLVLAEEEFGLKDQAPGADLTFELFVRGENPLETLGLLEFERTHGNPYPRQTHGTHTTANPRQPIPTAPPPRRDQNPSHRQPKRTANPRQPIPTAPPPRRDQNPPRETHTRSDRDNTENPPTANRSPDAAETKTQTHEQTKVHRDLTQAHRQPNHHHKINKGEGRAMENIGEGRAMENEGENGEERESSGENGGEEKEKKTVEMK